MLLFFHLLSLLYQSLSRKVGQTQVGQRRTTAIDCLCNTIQSRIVYCWSGLVSACAEHVEHCGTILRLVVQAQLPHHACNLCNEQAPEENQTYQSEDRKQSVDLRFFPDSVLQICTDGWNMNMEYGSHGSCLNFCKQGAKRWFSNMPKTILNSERAPGQAETDIHRRTATCLPETLVYTGKSRWGVM